MNICILQISSAGARVPRVKWRSTKHANLYSFLRFVYLIGAKAIEIDKSRSELEKELLKLLKKRKPNDLEKYFDKLDFDVDGLEYQLKIRNEWR